MKHYRIVRNQMGGFNVQRKGRFRWSVVPDHSVRMFDDTRSGGLTLEQAESLLCNLVETDRDDNIAEKELEPREYNCDDIEPRESEANIYTALDLVGLKAPGPASGQSAFDPAIKGILEKMRGPRSSLDTRLFLMRWMTHLQRTKQWRDESLGDPAGFPSDISLAVIARILDEQDVPPFGRTMIAPNPMQAKGSALAQKKR
jgi:hypothetical protein